jgi:hypothetical protein
MKVFRRSFAEKEYLGSENLVCFDKIARESYKDYFIVFPKVYILFAPDQRVELLPKDYLVEEQKDLFCLAFKRSMYYLIL